METKRREVSWADSWLITCYSPSLDGPPSQSAVAHFEHLPTGKQWNKEIGPCYKRITPEQMKTFKFVIKCQEEKDLGKTKIQIDCGGTTSFFWLSDKGHLQT